MKCKHREQIINQMYFHLILRLFSLSQKSKSKVRKFSKRQLYRWQRDQQFKRGCERKKQDFRASGRKLAAAVSSVNYKIEIKRNRGLISCQTLRKQKLSRAHIHTQALLLVVKTISIIFSFFFSFLLQKLYASLQHRTCLLLMRTSIHFMNVIMKLIRRWSFIATYETQK